MSLRHSVQRLVKSYLEDDSPEAYLSVGADMRKIQLCFQIMKVIESHCVNSVCELHNFSIQYKISNDIKQEGKVNLAHSCIFIYSSHLQCSRAFCH